MNETNFRFENGEFRAVIVEKSRENNLLTKSNPHPVGMKARMQTKMSVKVIPGSAIKVMKMDKNVRKISPFISRNTS